MKKVIVTAAIVACFGVGYYVFTLDDGSETNPQPNNEPAQLMELSQKTLVDNALEAPPTPTPTVKETVKKEVPAKPQEPTKAELAAKFRQEGAERKALTIEMEGAQGQERGRILRAVDQLNNALLTPGKSSAEAKTYEVRRGDSLVKIGKQFHITPALIRKMNGIKGDLIRIGQKLKVIEGPFNVKVDKSEFRLTVFLRDQVFKDFSIGLGIDGSTPVGEFEVKDKVSKPTWWDQGARYDFGDPHNPLGTRWITFHGPYGIHGTWEDDSIGKQMSRGCVRMHNKDVEEVFDLLVRHHSKVTITE